MIEAIKLVLQAVAMLLFTISSSTSTLPTPNISGNSSTIPYVSESDRTQAIDLTYQAIETVAQQISELTTPTTDETGKVLAPAAITETTTTQPIIENRELESWEVFKPCVLFPEKMCIYPIDPISNY